MFGWLKKRMESFKNQRELARQVDPKVIQQMAREIRELAELTARTNPENEDIRKQIGAIIHEMNRLDTLTDSPDFRRLTTSKRMALRQSLIQSREQLLTAIVSATPPTSVPQ